MTDLVLVNSPVHDYSAYPRYRSSYSTPVGLLYVGTAATRAGFRVSIIDAEARQLSPEEILGEVGRLKPRMVGLNTFSVNLRVVERIAEVLQEVAPIVVGGPHIASMPAEHFYQNLTAARTLVVGDGERAIVEILSGRNPEDIAGTYWRDEADGLRMNVKRAEVDLDLLDIPDRGLLPAEPYVRDGARWADISISRGCIFTCGFCAGSCKSNGSSYRTRSLDKVREELEHLTACYGVSGVQIVDDLPFANRRSLEAFLDMIENAGHTFEWELNLPLGFLRSLPEATIDRLAGLGLTRVNFGIESGEYQIRKRMGKKIQDDALEELVQRIASLGVSMKAYFIVGFPSETEVETTATFALAERLSLLSSAEGSGLFNPRIFVFKPMPGSAMWRDLRLQGHAEADLLGFEDFVLDQERYRKHAWSSTGQYAECSPERLRHLINDFYNRVGTLGGTG
jgi:anaerobic magnesium-protoporphyrin IX monomethyl ester cyclase